MYQHLLSIDALHTSTPNQFLSRSSCFCFANDVIILLLFSIYNYKWTTKIITRTITTNTKRMSIQRLI